ncbi:MAG: hypothetical protein AUK55_09265 [Syntrophobacteraceae bacterium CG2_30_61_12]|nr:MAG: hypothetical protein AUK55_09265 [Syntrophobacteraceae bacterium CG2_30_61_12]PIU32267.1 MAG: hybrid sensor histidine kinase/response regulator [Syntrophobacteraceae bacterium CG07_land_8_20_14_0_80_61_8]
MKEQASVLIVDDEPRMCESLRLLLHHHGYRICTAYNGAEARQQLRQAEFDVVLMDLIMPDTSGEQLVEFVNQGYPDTMVIVITGNASLESAVSVLRKGAYDYLRKPFEFEELLQTIKNALNQQRLKREKEQISGELEVSRDRYQYLVQNSPDIIYTLDPQGNFTFISTVATRLLGYSAEEIIGHHYTEMVYQEDLEQAKWVFNERRTGSRAASGVELHLKCSPLHPVSRCEEEDFLTVELKATGMYDKSVSDRSKRFLGSHGVMRDVSERKRLEKQLQQADKMQALGTMAAGIAHDFNNLLMGIQGLTSLILLKTSPTSPEYERLRNIEQHVQSGAALTSQLLGFARGNRGFVKSLDLNDVLHKTCNMFSRSRRSVTVHRIQQEGLWPVEVDRGQIEQVLLNLYLNASHAMPGGGDITVQSANVDLESSQARLLNLLPGRYVKLSVTDMGIGMDEETLQRIFEPFFTTKKAGRGTGLGLASAYAIVKNHGGAIDVKSRPGAGSTFDIYLPASDKGVSKEPVAAESMRRGVETVLLVDDEDIILETGGEILKALGYQVLLAKDPHESLDIYHSNLSTIDVVVLDLVMPGKGGGEVFDDLRTLNPRVKVLLSSGYDLDGEAAAIMKRGCDGFIQKPFTVEKLSRKLREVLDRSLH